MSGSVPQEDPLGGVEAPSAKVPTPPTRAPQGGLSGVPSFRQYADELSTLQAKGREVSEYASNAKRIAQSVVSALQASDMDAAKKGLEELKGLIGLKAVVGDALWKEAPARLRLLENHQVGPLLETYICCSTLFSFFERGIFCPEVPESFKVGVQDQDDEKYLLGLLDASRELERYALNRGQDLDLASIQICVELSQCLQQAFQQFDFRNSELRRRFDGLKYVVRKLEHVAYEVNLAKQRAAAGSAEVAGRGQKRKFEEFDKEGNPVPAAGAEGDSSSKALDVSVIAAIKLRYDKFDEARESVLKRGRDVIKAAKNAVYELQRGKMPGAEAQLKKATKDANAIHEDLVQHFPALRGSLFSASLEELAEALSLRAFLKEKKLLSFEEMQTASGLKFPLELHEYLGGILDLTGEIGRLAIKAAGKGRPAIAEVSLHLEVVSAVAANVQDLPFLPMGLNKKIGPMKGTISKIETALYELSLLSEGAVRLQAPKGGDEGAGDADSGPDAKM